MEKYFTLKYFLEIFELILTAVVIASFILRAILGRIKQIKYFKEIQKKHNERS